MIELADAARVRHLLRAPNVEAVRRHRDRALVQINVLDYGDDSLERSRRGNPFAYSYDSETADNPQNCWTLKRLHDSVRDIFRASVLDNLADGKAA